MRKSIPKIAITLLYFAVSITFLLQPARFANAFLDGITVWAHNVLPVLFPFALLTTLFTKVNNFDNFSITKVLFGIRCDKVFFCSILCGYPVGARTISEQNYDAKTATALCSFCSTPNPIFLVATVGTALGNTTATIIVCVSQLIAMLLNGWIYTSGRNFSLQQSHPDLNTDDFGKTIINSLLAVLTVGSLIALFFMLTEIIQSFLPQSIANHPALFFAIGLVEMTSGILKICSVCDIVCATVCVSALLSFGGICVALQCFAFLSQKGAKFGNLLKMKCTQCAFATVSAFVLSKLFL